MNHSYAMEIRDISRIDKLNKLTNKETFWDDVRKLTKRITSDHSIHRWQCLAEVRWNELNAANVSINIEKFLKQFNKEYDFLYDNRDMVAGYNEALIAGDKFIKEHPDFIREFVEYRGDFISSDREVVAFMFAMETMC